MDKQMIGLGGIPEKYREPLERVLNFIHVNDIHGVSVFDWELDGKVGECPVSGVNSWKEFIDGLRRDLGDIEIVDEKGFDDIVRFSSNPSQFGNISKVHIHRAELNRSGCEIWLSSSPNLSDKLVLTVVIGDIGDKMSIKAIAWKHLKSP